MSVQVAKDIVIKAQNLSRDYEYYEKSQGLAGSIKNIFHKEKLYKHAVVDLNIEIERGSIMGFIGLNGAGKTTTLKMLTGLLKPTSGNLSVLGYTPFQKKNDFLRQIALVMGNKSQLWWDIPAIETFQLNKTIYEVDDNTYNNNLNELVELLGVKDKLNIQVRRLSLGERMKMELIASLLHSPKIVFLDEPTLGLDILSQYAIRNFLKDYNERTKATIILTSHNFNDIVSLSKKLLIINKGEIIYSDSFSNFQKKFSDKKIITLKFKEYDKTIINAFETKGYTIEENISDNSIKISVDSENTVEMMQTVTNYYDNLIDLNIENIDTEEIVRNIYI